MQYEDLPPTEELIIKYLGIIIIKSAMVGA